MSRTAMLPVTAYDDVIRVLANPDIRRTGDSGADPMTSVGTHRILIATAGRRRCAELRAGLVARAESLLDAVFARGSGDLIDDFVAPFVFTALFDMVGIPEEDREFMRRWAYEDLHRPGDVARVVDRQSVRNHWDALSAYLPGLLRRKKPAVDGDVCAALEFARLRGELSAADVLRGIGVMLMAGHSLTTIFISEALLGLLADEDKRMTLLQRPELVPQATEEMLRFLAPANATPRSCPYELEIGGSTVPPNTLLDIQLKAANRDPGRFSSPDMVDFDRADNRHLAFSYGPSYCPGAPLARMEAQIAINAVLARADRMALDIPLEQITWSLQRYENVPSIDALPIRCTTGATAAVPGLAAQAASVPRAAASP